MLNRIQILIVLQCVLLLSACSLLPPAEVCNCTGAVFTNFVENQDDWWIYFNENPDDNYLRIEINDQPYVVRVYRRENSLPVITDEGFGPDAGFPGRSGYISVDPEIESSVLENLQSSDVRTTVYLSDNIYCYRY
jgi:hypothetical protein